MQKNSKIRPWGLACLVSLGSAAAFTGGCTGYESHRYGPEDGFTFALSGGAYLSLTAFVIALVGLIVVAARSES
jgi:hypothetical protein